MAAAGEERAQEQALQEGAGPDGGKNRGRFRVISAMTQTPEKIVYTAEPTSSGGRNGQAVSSDGILEVALTAPQEMGGPGTGTNPEQLFAAGSRPASTARWAGWPRRPVSTPASPR